MPASIDSEYLSVSHTAFISVMKLTINSISYFSADGNLLFVLPKTIIDCFYHTLSQFSVHGV